MRQAAAPTTGRPCGSCGGQRLVASCSLRHHGPEAAPQPQQGRRRHITADACIAAGGVSYSTAWRIRGRTYNTSVHGSSNNSCCSYCSHCRCLGVNGRSGVTCCASSASDAEPAMTPEEEAIYNEILAARRSKKKAEIREYKRRSNFDPLAKGAKVADPDVASASSAVQDDAPGRENLTIPARQPSAATATPAAARELLRPAQAAALSQTARPTVRSGGDATSTAASTPRGESTNARTPMNNASGAADDKYDDDDNDDDEEPDEAEFEAAALRFLREEEEEQRRKAQQRMQQQQQQQGAPEPTQHLRPQSQLASSSSPASAASAQSPAQQQAVRRRAVLAPGAYKPGATLARLGPTTPAAARKQQQQQQQQPPRPLTPAVQGLSLASNPDDVQSSNSGSSSSNSASSSGNAAAAAGRLGTEAAGSTHGAVRPNPNQHSAPAASGKGTSGASDASDTARNQRPGAGQAGRGIGPQAAGVAGVAAAGATAAAAGAGGLKNLDFEGLDAGVDWDTLIAGESFEKYVQQLQKEEEQAQLRRQRASQNAAASPSGRSGAAALTPADAEEAQLEELLKLFELVDEQQEGEGSSNGRASAGAATTTGFARVQGEAGQKLEDSIDWGVLEKVFLGEDWDKEIRELAEKANSDEDDEEDEDGSGGAAATPGAGGSGGAASDGEAPLWADEVTTLLLGLVSISYERYLDKPLLDCAVSEEERATAFWEAPFALLVQDDSKESMLEYANKRALDLLGHNFEDIYELSSFDVVDSEETQQQEWLWATAEVEERMAKHTVVPLLRLRGAGGRRLVARDVLVFRVDNLQGDAMGQAVLIRDCQREA